jgi:SAM-dependent methyltransferase
MTGVAPSRQTSFRAAYAKHRAAEGRRLDGDELLALPYLTTGPLARQWRVRARTFDAFVRRVLTPASRSAARPLAVLDVGAGNGWLAYRASLAGCETTALDLRDDDVDGLGAASHYLRATPARFHRVAASFDSLPLARESFDVAVFNASLHYATDLAVVLREAHRVVRGGGRIVVLDSPFYARDEHGEAMVAEKRRLASERFGARADALLALPFVEYLTADRLATATAGLELAWRRHRVRYPVWYEARGLIARLRGRRATSRFDVWECTVP